MPSRRAAHRIALISAVVLAVALPLVIGLLVTRVLSGSDRHEGGRTFYVNPDGDDASDGLSREHAWQTLTRASRERLQPGDHILMAGRITGTLSLRQGEAGDPRNPVVIDSYGGSRAYIVSDLGIDVRDTAGITVRNVGIYGSGSSTVYRGVSIVAGTGVRSRLTGITLENLDVSGFVNGISIGAEGPVGFSDVHVTDSVVHDNRNDGLAIYGPKFDNNLPRHRGGAIRIRACRHGPQGHGGLRRPVSSECDRIRRRMHRGAGPAWLRGHQ